MHDTLDFAHGPLGHTLLALALGVAVMILAALALERLLARAAMRRLLWQAVLLGLGALLAFELTGMGRAASALWLAPSHTAATIPAAQANPQPIAANPWKGPVAPDRMPDLDGTYGFFRDEIWSLAWAEPPYHSSATAVEDSQTDGRSLPPNAFGTPSSNASKIPTPSSETPALPIVEEPAESHVTAIAAAPAAAARPRGQLPASAVWCLAIAWAAGACLLLGRTVLARARLNRALRQWEPVDAPDLARLIKELGERVGVRRRVCVARVAGLPAPVAFGLWRPTVLLPADFAQRFSPSQQQVILAHELAHLAANDPAWLLGGELMTALFWWHPLAHVARWRLLAASEQAADEASVLVPNGPDVLADCLVKLGRRLSGKPRFGWVAAEGSGLRSGLARRVQRLLKLSERPTPLPARRVLATAKPVVVLLLLVLTISCTLWAHPKASFAKGEDSMNVLSTSWRQSLAAAALTAFLAPLAADAADDAPAPPPKPAQLEEGSPADQVLLAQRGDRERREREADRDREHREWEARGDRERGERERDMEHRERAEREGDEHRERSQAEREELRRRAEELEREKAEFSEQAERGAHELEQAMRETQEEREGNARHIGELEEQLAKLKREFKEEANEELEKRIDRLSSEVEKAQDVRAELAKRAENLEREMGEHRENVERRMVELQQQFAEVHGQLERIEATFARANPERAELMKRVHEMAREIGELHKVGKHDEAARLEREMGPLHERLAAPRDRERPEGREPERREGMERLEAMEHRLHELREAGRHDAAEEMERELHELHRRLNAPRDGDRPGPPPELQVRMEHLHVAMENLHAAGLHDQAEQIAQQIERLVRERAPGPPERHDPDAPPRGPRPEGRPGPGGEIVGQLRGEIEQLRRENEEMRRMMQEIREAQERLMNELRERR